MTDIPTWLLILVGAPIATLIAGWWIMVAIAFIHVVKTAHLKDDDEEEGSN